MSNAHHIENTLVARPNPKTFEMEFFAKSSHRHLFRVDTNNNQKFVNSYEPERAAESYLEAELAKLGTVTVFEQHLTSSLFNCCRGCVERDGRVYWFSIEYDFLYLTMVEGLVEAAQLTLDGRKAS